MSRPTRNDVAREAGVSSATVSRVYNDHRSVSPEKVERIRLAAEKLGYQPNRQASSLRRKGSGIITLAAFVKKECPDYWGNQPLLKWMYADIIRSVLEEVSLSLFHFQIQTIETEKDLEILKDSDGIIGYDIDSPDEADTLAGLGKPYIICHHVEELTGHPATGTNNRRGGALQAEWLKSRGVCHPLYVTGRINEVPADRRRMEGFLEAYGSENITVIDSISGVEEGKARSRDVAAYIRKENFDGMACVNDMTLLGILTGAEGISTPCHEFRNIPLVGYDNLPVLPLFPEPPATIDLRLNLIYRTGVRRLIKTLKGQPKQKDRVESITISPELKDWNSR